MAHKQLAVIAVLVIFLAALSGCGMFGQDSPNVRPSPTLPLGTPVVQPTQPGQPPAQTGSIAGTVFDDQNGNGARDANEPAIVGVHVALAAGACGSPATAKTVTAAGEPSYTFDGLKAGVYCVSIDAQLEQNRAVLQTGAWTFPVPGNNVSESALQLAPGAKLPDVNFGWKYLVAPQPTAPQQPTMLPTPTAVSSQATSVPAPACTFKAQYLADVTIADNSILAPGQQFTKTWRLKNAGTCAWGPGSALHQIVFVGGTQLGAQPTVEIPNVIAAGAEGEISIPMVAPTTPGRYKSNWKLRADNGAQIGVGPSNVALYAQIIVQGTPPPTAVPPPTGVPPPTAPPSNVIQFAPGATETEVQGTLPANGAAAYLINVQPQQTMILALASNSSSARIAVLDPNGAPLKPERDNPEGTYWQGITPVVGNYIIQVLAGNATPTANFSLSVVIPQRITFAPGTDSAAVAGTSVSGRIMTYLLRANSGQKMTARLTAPTDTVGLTIYGLEDGQPQPLIRAQTGATSFEGTLPGTQDYVIQVVPLGEGAVNYTLQVVVR